MVLLMQMRKSAAQWGELVSAWEASGLAADAFASKHGVAGSTLRWWKTELARRARSELRRRPPRRESPPPPPSGIALARVVRPGEGPKSATARGGVAVLAGGSRVVVEPGFDSRLLREVVRALEEAR
jgi:hypothetical protein